MLLLLIIYTYIYIEQDENSIMSWSKNVFNYYYNTTKIFHDPVAFFSGTMLIDKTMEEK